MKKIILIGAGGHCNSCIDVIESTGKYQIIGLTGTVDESGSSVLGYPVLGSDDKLGELRSRVKWCS